MDESKNSDVPVVAGKRPPGHILEKRVWIWPVLVVLLAGLVGWDLKDLFLFESRKAHIMERLRQEMDLDEAVRVVKEEGFRTYAQSKSSDRAIVVTRQRLPRMLRLIMRLEATADKLAVPFPPTTFRFFFWIRNHTEFVLEREDGRRWRAGQYERPKGRPKR